MTKSIHKLKLSSVLNENIIIKPGNFLIPKDKEDWYLQSKTGDSILHIIKLKNENKVEIKNIFTKKQKAENTIISQGIFFLGAETEALKGGQSYNFETKFLFLFNGQKFEFIFQKVLRDKKNNKEAVEEFLSIINNHIKKSFIIKHV